MFRFHPITAIFLPAVVVMMSLPVYAQEFNKDLSISNEGVKAAEYLLAGKTTRVYTTVQNNSNQDLFGVVKFYDETESKFIGQDQPVSILAGKTDDVFVDWEAKHSGDNRLSVRVIPWDLEGDDPSNNKVTRTLYVDVDSDGDGVGNREDVDDDNDGVNDRDDAFPFDPSESRDTDGDGIGDNEDEDDDGDGVSDVRDAFRLNFAEWEDSDGDGVGNNADVFPADPNEFLDTDNDGLGDNDDPNDNNKGPVAVIDTKEAVVTAGDITTFNALKSYDADGDITTYYWDFGDGTHSNSVIVDHKFKKPGSYDVTLKVTDDKGEYRKTTLQMTVVYKWQTMALAIIAFLLFLIFVIHGFMTRKRLREDASFGREMDTVDPIILHEIDVDQEGEKAAENAKDPVFTVEDAISQMADSSVPLKKPVKKEAKKPIEKPTNTVAKAVIKSKVTKKPQKRLPKRKK